MAIPIALQLYTVRDVMSQDFEGTLAEVARMGYTHVELAGFYERTPAQVRALCDRLGLTITSAHYVIDQLRDNLGEALAAAKALGFKHLICPWLGPDYRGAEGYAKVVH